MISLALFALLSILAIVFGLKTLVQTIQNWKSLWDDDLTQEDAKLASTASFYLLIPPTVLLHELGHAIAVWAFGLEVIDFWFLGYMGAVFHAPSTAFGNFTIALAGNVVTLAIGAACVWWGYARPGHPVRNILWIDLGRQSLFLVLVFYPLICLAFDGDFRTIYSPATPIASTITAVAHAAILILTYRVIGPRIRPRTRLLCSPQATKLVEAEAKLGVDPSDLLAHRTLGLMYFAALDFVRARRYLDPVIASGKVDAQLRLAYGTALIELDEPAKAVPFLEQAKEGLLRPEDRNAAARALELAKGRSATKD